MSAIEIPAKWNTGAKDPDGKVIYANTKVPFNFGGDLVEAVELFGEDAVFDNYRLCWF